MAPYIGLMRGMSRRDIQIVVTFLNEVMDEAEEKEATVSSDNLVEMARKKFNVPESPESKWFREHGPEAAFLLDLGKRDFGLFS